MSGTLVDILNLLNQLQAQVQQKEQTIQAQAAEIARLQAEAEAKK